MQMSGVPRWSSGEDSALSLLKQVCRGVSGSERQEAAELGLEWGADLVPQRGEQGGRARGRQAPVSTSPEMRSYKRAVSRGMTRSVFSPALTLAAARKIL